MMSSSPETSTRTPGARSGARRTHREARDRAAARTLAQRPPTRYEPYLDGLFTYCLSVLCDHDAATAALGDALALAERRGQRAPETTGDRRAWLYALARWSCLRKLAEAKQKRQAHHAAGRPTARHGSAQPAPAAVPEEEQRRRRRELARLAWPEAAGTSPEQREALELAVRHHLAAHEVAAVLGMDLAAARDLLASAACEVERTRAALAVVETGNCPGVARLTGDGQLVLSSAVRKELVRHVDDCPRCRRTAERAVPGRWPGSAVTPAELPVLEAPRAALHLAMAHHPRARGGAPRFDRRGFPMDPKDRAARRDRLRARAVTTTVVATVVAAPVIALWSAYRGAPVAGEGEEGRATATSREDDQCDGKGAADRDGYGYENAGNATEPDPGSREDPTPDVSVEVLGVDGPGHQAAGRLDITADSIGDTTLITLTASGATPVRWSVATHAPWLYPSRSAGTLRPGETFTIKVYVDHLREPSGHWSARVTIAPAGAVVSLRGSGTAPRPSDPAPTRPHPDPRPISPGSRPPTTPPPDPTPPPTTPAPSDPTPSDPPPTSQDPGPTPDPEPPPSEPPPSTSQDPGPPTGDSGDPSPPSP
ncbi:MAG: hypothetical protein H5T76_28495 [Streptomyces sp.]|nr:hypothetical protein [Streptomyces sp.]